MKAYHTLEIPFAFDNVDEAKTMTGDHRDRDLRGSEIACN
jgi:hypothetical protein